MAKTIRTKNGGKTKRRAARKGVKQSERLGLH